MLPLLRPHRPLNVMNWKNVVENCFGIHFSLSLADLFLRALNFNRNESRDDFIFAFELRIVKPKYQSSIKMLLRRLKLEIVETWFYCTFLCCVSMPFECFAPFRHIFIPVDSTLFADWLLMDSFHVLHLKCSLALFRFINIKLSLVFNWAE